MPTTYYQVELAQHRVVGPARAAQTQTDSWNHSRLELCDPGRVTWLQPGVGLAVGQAASLVARGPVPG